MSSWENLHSEILVYIYQYLSRRDRLACSLVNYHWKISLDHPSLWKTMLICIDIDFYDTSTILLIRDYNRHLKNLSFGWTSAYLQYDGLYLTKKAVRFLLILHDSYVQIQHLKLFNWPNGFYKINYHLTRFLSIQFNLKKITLQNINLVSMNFRKILPTFVNSKNTLICFDLITAFHYRNSTKLIYFQSCVEQMIYLRTLCLDYVVLSSNLMDALMISKNECLENLDVYIQQPSWPKQIINNQQWSSLKRAYPKIKVSFMIRGNCYYHEEIAIFLKRTVPLTCFSMILSNFKNDWSNFAKILTLIISNYRDTLDNVEICVKTNSGTFDNILPKLFKKCKNLKTKLQWYYVKSPSLIKLLS